MHYKTYARLLLWYIPTKFNVRLDYSTMEILVPSSRNSAGSFYIVFCLAWLPFLLYSRLSSPLFAFLVLLRMWNFNDYHLMLNGMHKYYTAIRNAITAFSFLDLTSSSDFQTPVPGPLGGGKRRASGGSEGIAPSRKCPIPFFTSLYHL